MAKIFISIAAYRDPELLPTLHNCLEMAARPQDLRFCIAWQHAGEDEWDRLGEFFSDPRFEIIDIPYREAHGVCWARSEIQKRYNGEEYYLQLDSHHRFCPGWDEALLDSLHYLQAIGHEKPLLSAYLPVYHPGDDPDRRPQVVYSLNIDRFLPEGIAFLGSHHVPNWKKLPAPFPARFVSAHFLFAQGRFAREVPYDPAMYFHGEESSLAVRAFTHGYDLFSPHRPLIWHEYIRKGKTRHWNDFTDWPARNNRSYARYRELFGMDDTPRPPQSLGEFDFGTKRSLADYELYAGIKFRERRIHQETLRGDFPPIKTDFESGLTNRNKICIDVYKESLRESDYDFFAVALLDKDGADLYRQDCGENEIRGLFETAPEDRFIHIWRAFDHEERPHKSRIWPHSKSKGWMNQIEQVIPYV